MGLISTAVGDERVSRVVGYQVKAGNFLESTPNLPQSVVVFAEANADKQVGLDVTKREITSAAEAAEIYGNGSPIHSIMRIMRPPNGGGLGGIPTFVIAQAEAGSALAAEREITITGAPTGTGEHFLSINGRTSIDGSTYGFVIASTDTPTTIASKVSDVINNALNAPCSASAALGVVTITAKWLGKTSEQLDIQVLTGDNVLGLAYAIATTETGAGTQTIATDLAKIGSEWNTIVVNSYDDDTFAELEAFNGTPDAATPVGRYEATVFKPFMALWGSVEQDKDSLVVLTNDAARKDQVTNVLCPAPNSKGFTYEAAANGALIIAPIYQNTPHLSVNAQSYNDMPVPSDGLIGDMSDYNNRDFLVKKGCSTVDFVNGKYTFQDLVTTYAPTGDNNPSWRYARSINQDNNVRYGYFLLEQIHVRDHALVASNQVTSVTNVIKPKMWIGVVSSMFDDFAKRAIISDPDFTKDSLQVGVSEFNPDRLETSFKYKRSGIARIASTTAEAGFAFGVR